MSETLPDPSQRDLDVMHDVMRGTVGAPPYLLVAAHPDDETIGAGGLLARVRPAAVVIVTDGAPLAANVADPLHDPARLQHVSRRRRELECALATAGIDATQIVALDVVDQGAAANIAIIARALLTLFAHHRPALVVTHPYEGGHPDHDATACAVHAACAVSRRRHGVAPAIVEMTSYHVRAGALVAGTFAAPPADLRGPDLVVALSVDEQRRKNTMLGCYASQRDIVQTLVRAASTRSAGDERFRVAPAYDFTAPPPADDDGYAWIGLSAARTAWPPHVQAAWHALALPAPPWR